MAHDGDKNAARDDRNGAHGGTQVKIRFSPQLMNDLAVSVQAASATLGIINIPQLAEEIRKRNEAENIALEDIAEEVMRQAQLLSAAMEFDRAVVLVR
jgi:hypothetical protein